MIKIKLKQILWEKNMTSAEINRLTGLNKANLSNIARGKHTNVGLDTLNTLCNCLKCDLNDLVEYIPD